MWLCPQHNYEHLGLGLRRLGWSSQTVKGIVSWNKMTLMILQYSWEPSNCPLKGFNVLKFSFSILKFKKSIRFTASCILGYFAQQSIGTVKTGLPTQILKNHFNTLKVKIMVYKGPRTCFRRIPKFAFLGGKSSKLATLIQYINKCLGPGPEIFPRTRTVWR
jgi:hypothetical protein